jgi:hypothetical protein
MTKEEKSAYMREYHQEHKDDPEYRAMRARSGKKNREKNNIRRAKWATADREAYKEEHRAYEFAREMKKYNTTVEWYLDMLIKQSGLCAICGHLSHHHGTIQRLQVDHDHACCNTKTMSCGKCLRGLLCADCNMNLSYLEKFYNECAEISPSEGSWTYRALQYLDSYRFKTQETPA